MRAPWHPMAEVLGLQRTPRTSNELRRPRGLRGSVPGGILVDSWWVNSWVLAMVDSDVDFDGFCWFFSLFVPIFFPLMGLLMKKGMWCWESVYHFWFVCIYQSLDNIKWHSMTVILLYQYCMCISTRHRKPRHSRSLISTTTTYTRSLCPGEMPCWYYRLLHW